MTAPANGQEYKAPDQFDRLRGELEGPPDDTLDGLLLALASAPRAAALVELIADRLEETGHPAAAWWRLEADFLVCLGPDGWRIYLRNGRYDGPYAGWVDLCGRLRRLHGSPPAVSVEPLVLRGDDTLSVTTRSVIRD
jgi:hypothetical protein